MNDKTKSKLSTATKLKRVAKLSRENPKMEFNCLMPHFNKESLMSCFNELNGRKAVGIDRQTKVEYGKNLDANLDQLLDKMKSMSYRPSPVREVLIPKDNGKKRPLGISNFEDKIVQLMFSKILESIYEPIFYDFSFGFRRGRSCHQAVKACHKHLYEKNVNTIIDVDLENFFGTIKHEKLIKLLRMKIKDDRFIRYIVRMLKAGILSNGELMKADEGTPQGSVVSPILANIFAHYALDQWFNEIVRRRSREEVAMFRYCDDLVICSKSKIDAERITQSLKGRLERFSLKLNEDKTKKVSFNKNQSRAGRKQGTFDFLGFTFYLAKQMYGPYYVPKVRTSGGRYRKKLSIVKDWCKTHRCKYKLRRLWDIFCSKLRGHIQYYGVSHNSHRVQSFVNKAIRIFYRWTNRRSQKKSMDWERFRKFIEAFPAPKVRVYHDLFTN